MKKVTLFLLVFTLLAVLSACQKDIVAVKNPVTYYYKTTNTDYNATSGMVASEVRDATGHNNEYPYLIEQYLNGPRSSDCVSPFPAGTTLEEFELDTNKAMVKLSPHISTLSGANLMFACVCLTKTVSEMTGARSVQIAIVDGTINGNSTVTLTPDSFVLWNNQ